MKRYLSYAERGGALAVLDALTAPRRWERAAEITGISMGSLSSWNKRREEILIGAEKEKQGLWFCNKCEKWKSVEDFKKQKGQCQPCINERKRQYNAAYAARKKIEP